MRLLKKITPVISAILFTAGAAVIFSTCKPAIGTPWYPRSVSSDSVNFLITDIKVKDLPVTPVLAETLVDDADKIKKFSEAATYMVNIPPEVTEISAEDITVTAVSSLSRMEAVTVEVTINGGSVPLSSGQAVPVTVKIADPAGRYAVQEKILSITQSDPYDLSLTSLKIFGKEVFVNGTLQQNVTVPYTKSSITAKDITASFSYGSHTTVIPVELEKPSIKLYENEAVEFTLSVKEKRGQYQAFECTVTVTRALRPDDADPALEPEAIFILGVRSEEGKAFGVPIETEKVTEADIVAVFKDFGDLPVILDPSPAEFGNRDSMELKLSVPKLAGKYEGWETSVTVKKDPTAVYNPQDKNGNKKYIVKVNTITEKISPFDYYKENYAGFSASKFDEWVLVMPSMSGIIASYKFQSGSWSGTPDSFANTPDSIGSGFEKIWNVKIYRYKSRAERWSAHGGYIPTPDSKDSRFYFYRFTADAAMGITPDSSMFCVDRYSKFLFYYSEPATIKWVAGSALPTEWTDYAAASKGDHEHFTEPFYMSDPVGYVKDDGSVVMYQWIKDNINKAVYHAQKNSAYTKAAARKPGGAGYSPYRHDIEQKRNEVITTENPDYTVAMPVILGQPKAVRVKLNAPEEAVFTVKTAPAPKGEELSYQWYKNETQSTEGGTPIDGENGTIYSPDTSTEADCYVYCAVTNRNSSNGAAETVHSRAVKLLVSDGSLAIDAEQPQIINQPVGKIFSKSAPENERRIELKIKADCLDKKGELSYQWYKNSTDDTSTAEVIGGATADSYSFTVGTTVGVEYYYCQVTNTNNTVDGDKTASIFTAPARIEVEESYPVFFGKEGEGSITAIYEQHLLDSEHNKYVKKDKTVTFFAQAKDGWEVVQWVGIGLEIAENKLSATIVVSQQETIKVIFREIPNTRRLTITAKKIVNKDLGGRDYIASFINGEVVQFAYFIYNFRARIFENTAAKGSFTSLWSKLNGRDLVGLEQVNLAEWLYTKGNGPYLMVSDEGAEQSIVQNFDNLPAQYYFQLDTKLVKYDRHRWGKWTNKQFISEYEQSIMDFEYHKDNDEWVYRKAEYSIPNVTVTPPENFVLKRGQTKEFTIEYYVDNPGNQAVGTVEVTYTLKWE